MCPCAAKGFSKNPRVIEVRFASPAAAGGGGGFVSLDPSFPDVWVAACRYVDVLGFPVVVRARTFRAV